MSEFTHSVVAADANSMLPLHFTFSINSSHNTEVVAEVVMPPPPSLTLVTHPMLFLSSFLYNNIATQHNNKQYKTQNLLHSLWVLSFHVYGLGFLIFGFLVL